MQRLFSRMRLFTYCFVLKLWYCYLVLDKELYDLERMTIFRKFNYDVKSLIIITVVNFSGQIAAPNKGTALSFQGPF